jgi:hypothetical protein
MYICIALITKLLDKRLHKGLPCHICVAFIWLVDWAGWIGHQHVKLCCCQGSEALGKLGHRPVDATGIVNYDCIPASDDLVSILFVGLMPPSNLLLQLPQHMLSAPDLLRVTFWIQELCLAHLWLGLREVVAQRLVISDPIFPRMPPTAQSVSWQSQLVCTSTRQRCRWRC